jgi:hypothetical protein
MSNNNARPNRLITAVAIGLISASVIFGTAQALPLNQDLKLSSKAIVTPVASKKIIRDEASSKGPESTLSAAAKKLRRSDEFLKAAEARDADVISSMLLKQSGLDVPLTVKFKDEVNIQNLTVFIGCQKINGQWNCGIWIY